MLPGEQQSDETNPDVVGLGQELTRNLGLSQPTPVDQFSQDPAYARQPGQTMTPAQPGMPSGWNQLINDRTRTWDDSFWKQNPTLAAQIATSNLPEHIIRTLPQHWNKLSTWVDDQNALGGVSGALTNARLKALNISNPTVRANALSTIDAWQQLSPADQTSIMALIKNPQLMDIAPSGVGAAYEAAAHPQGLANFLGVTPQDVTAGGGQITISGQEGTDFSTATTSSRIAFLESQFPALKGKIHFDAGGVSMQDYADSFDRAANETKLSMQNLAFGIPVETAHADKYGIPSVDIKTRAREVYGTGFQGVTNFTLSNLPMLQPINYGLRGTQAAANWFNKAVMPSVPVGPVQVAGITFNPGAALHTIGDIGSMTNRIYGAALNGTAEEVGSLGLSAWNNIPGQNVSHQSLWYDIWSRDAILGARDANGKLKATQPSAMEQIVGNLGLSGMIIAADAAGRAESTASKMPKELAGAQMGLLNEDGSLMTPKEAIKSAGLKQTLMHPLQTLIGRPIEASTLGHTGMTVDEFFGDSPQDMIKNNPLVTKVFERALAINNDPTILDKVDAIQSTLGFQGTIGNRLAIVLAGSDSIESMRQGAIDLMTGTPQEVIDRQVGLVKAHQQALQQAQAALDAAKKTEVVRPIENPTDIPSTPVPADAEPQVRQMMDNLSQMIIDNLDNLDPVEAMDIIRRLQDLENKFNQDLPVTWQDVWHGLAPFGREGSLGIDPQQVIEWMNGLPKSVRPVAEGSPTERPDPQTVHSPDEATMLDIAANTDPNYRIHVTNLQGFDGIIQTGLEPRQNFYGINPDTILPEQRVPRLFTADSIEHAVSATSFRDERIILRMPTDALGVLQDDPAGAPGSKFSRTPVPVDKLEFLGEDGNWYPVVGPDSVAQAKVDAVQHSLTVETANLQAMLDKKDPEQVYWPGANNRTLTAFLHRAIADPRGSTPIERFVEHILDPRITVKRWSNSIFHTNFGTTVEDKLPNWWLKLTNKVDNHPTLINPLSDKYDSLAQEHNSEVIRRTGQMLHIPTPDLEAVTRQLHDAKSPTDVQNALVHFAELRKAYVPKGTSNAVKAALGRAYDNDFYQGYNTVDTTIDEKGNTISHPVRSKQSINGTPQASPFLPAEFLAADTIFLPSLELQDMATHTLKRWASAGPEATSLGGKIKGTVGTGFAVASLSARMLGRTTMFPLWAAFRLPALIAKHRLDPLIGNEAMGISMSGGRGSLEPLDSLSNPDPKSMGSITEGLTDQGVPYNHAVPTAQYIVDGKLTSEGTRALMDKMDYYHNDMVSQRILRNGLDVQKTVNDMLGGDPAMSHFYETRLAADGVTPEELPGLIQRQVDAIKQASLGVPEYLDYMRTGRMPTDVISTPQIEQNLNDIRRSLAQQDPSMPGGREAIKELQQRQRELMAQRPTQEGPTTVHVDTGDLPFEEDLKRRFSQNGLDLPKEVVVKRYGRGSYRDPVTGEPRNEPGKLEQLRELDRRISKFTYGAFKPVGWADKKGRAGFYTARGYDWYRTYIANGMDPEAAAAKATMRAGIETRDISYDLAARSSAERAVRNIFWFAPVQGEMFYRWFYAIPARMSGSALGGAASLYAKWTAYSHLALALGVVHKNAQGEMVIPVTGAAHLLQTLTGGNFKFTSAEQVGIPLASLDPLVSKPVPTMGPIAGKALSEAAKHIPALKGIARTFAPFGDSSTLIPYDVRNTMATIFHVNMPDLMSNDLVDEQWKRTHILATQYALADMKKNDPEPTLAQFNLDPAVAGYLAVGTSGREAAEAAYKKAHGEWIDRLMQDSNEIARGLYGLHVVFGGILPGNALVTSQAKDEWDTFLKNNAHLSPAEYAVVKDKFLSSHPEALPFSISGGVYTGKPVKPGMTPQEMYSEGVKQYMDPTEYARYAAIMQSKWLYDSRKAAALDSLAPTGDPTDILRNWYRHTTIIGQHDTAWSNYQMLNPEAKAIYDFHTAKIAEAYPAEAQRTLEAQVITETLQGMNQLAPLFTGEGGVTTSEFNTVLGTIKAERARIFAETQKTGIPLSPTTEGVFWYFDNVIGPYMDKVQPIYDELTKLKDAGLSGSAQAQADYAKIDALRTQYSGSILDHGGKTYPSPDEFFFDAKSPTDQKITIAHWVTEPVQFLSDFARQKVGYTTFNGEDEMWQKINAFDSQSSATLSLLQPGTSQYDAFKQYVTVQEQAIAAQYGKDGISALSLSQAAPYVRMQSLGMFKDDPTMQQAFAMATTINTTLQAQGLSPLSSAAGSEAAGLKTWFYDWIAQQDDPKFLNDLDLLSNSLTSGPKGDHPLGAYLYENIFFGQTQSAFVSSTVRNAAGGNLNG